jgi:hypothetical protein
LLDLGDRANDEREIPVKRAIEHIPYVALAGGVLFLAMRANLTPQGRGIIQYVVAVRRLNNVHNARKIFFQSAVELGGKAAVSVTVAVDAFHAYFLLDSFPILFKHDGPPLCYESQ